MFDNLSISKLGYYVYALINPINNKPFYIGKGKENRVFSHKEEVINGDEINNSLKKDEIKSILDSGLNIEHIIIRHGLKESESFLLEASLIDFVNFYSFGYFWCIDVLWNFFSVFFIKRPFTSNRFSIFVN